MKTIWIFKPVILALLLGYGLIIPRLAKGDIQVLGSDVKKLTEGTTVSYVHIKINTTPGSSHETSSTVITLSNLVKPYEDKPNIFSNATKTIVGFNTSYVRRNWQINLLWCSASGQCFLDQYVNNRLANLLTDSKVKQAQDGLDPILFTLDAITGNTLNINFRSDTANKSFHFQVHIEPDGELKLVPHSVKMDGGVG